MSGSPLVLTALSNSSAAKRFNSRPGPSPTSKASGSSRLIHNSTYSLSSFDRDLARINEKYVKTLCQVQSSTKREIDSVSTSSGGSSYGDMSSSSAPSRSHQNTSYQISAPSIIPTQSTSSRGSPTNSVSITPNLPTTEPGDSLRELISTGGIDNALTQLLRGAASASGSDRPREEHPTRERFGNNLTVRQTYRSSVPSQSRSSNNSRSERGTSRSIGNSSSSNNSSPYHQPHPRLSLTSLDSRLAHSELQEMTSFQLTKDCLDCWPRPISYFCWPDFLTDFARVGRRGEGLGRFGEVILACHVTMGAKFTSHSIILGDSVVARIGQRTKLTGDLLMVGKSRNGQCKLLLERCLNTARNCGLLDEGSPSKESICALLMLESVVTLFGSVTQKSRDLIDMAAKQVLAMVRDPFTPPDQLAPVLEPLGLAHWVFVMSRDAIVAAGLCRVPSLTNEELSIIFNNPMHPRSIGFNHYISGGFSLLDFDATKDIEGHLEIVQVCGRSMDREVLQTLIPARTMAEVEMLVRSLWKKQDSLKAWFSLHHRFAKQGDSEPRIGPKKLQADRIRAEMLIQSKLVFICHRLITNKLQQSSNQNQKAQALWLESKQRVSEQINQLALFIRDLLEAAYETNTPRLLSLRTACVIQKLLPDGVKYLIHYLTDDTVEQTANVRINNIKALVMGWKCCGWSWTEEYGEVAVVDLFVRRSERTLVSAPNTFTRQSTSSVSSNIPLPARQSQTQQSSIIPNWGTTQPSCLASESSWLHSTTPNLSASVPTSVSTPMRRAITTFDSLPTVDSVIPQRSITISDFGPAVTTTGLSPSTVSGTTDLLQNVEGHPFVTQNYTAQSLPPDNSTFGGFSNIYTSFYTTPPSQEEPTNISTQFQNLFSSQANWFSYPQQPSVSSTTIDHLAAMSPQTSWPATTTASPWAILPTDPIYPQNYPFTYRAPEVEHQWNAANTETGDISQYLGDWNNDSG